MLSWLADTLACGLACAIERGDHALPDLRGCLLLLDLDLLLPGLLFFSCSLSFFCSATFVSTTSEGSPEPRIPSSGSPLRAGTAGPLCPPSALRGTRPPAPL